MFRRRGRKISIFLGVAALLVAIAAGVDDHFSWRRALANDGEQISLLKKEVALFGGALTQLTREVSSPSTQGQVNVPAAGSSLVQLPEGIQMIWVIFQKPGPLKEGTSYLYAYVTPEEFAQRIEEFRDAARSQGMKLIVTAYAGNNQWVDSQIKYNGKLLEPMVPYFYSGRVEYGSEVPLE